MTTAQGGAHTQCKCGSLETCGECRKRIQAATGDLLAALQAVDAWASDKSAHNERSIIATVRAAIAKAAP